MSHVHDDWALQVHDTWLMPWQSMLCAGALASEKVRDSVSGLTPVKSPPTAYTPYQLFWTSH